MTDPAFLSTAALARAIAAGDYGVGEILDHFLDRQDRLGGPLNAVVARDIDAARARARAADEARARGESLGPLHGVPFTIKDSIEVEGLVSTGGAPQWRDHMPARDADAVARLRAAGANILGKTNVPYMSGDWQTANEIYGRTSNPWNPERTPGGSSGGPAAALAAGLTGGDIGSDIGGSIRMPAHFCGLFGHKPTFDLVPARGHIPPPPDSLSTPDMAVTGPLGRGGEDLDLLLGIMADVAPARTADAAGLRVAVMSDDPFCRVGSEIISATEQAAKILESAGATVSRDAEPPVPLSEAFEIHLVQLTAILSPGFPEKTLAFLAEHAATVSDDDRDPLALQARGAVLTYAQAMALWEKRKTLERRWAAWFEDHDVLLCPVAPVAAFAHDTDRPVPKRRLTVNGQERPYMDLLPWMSQATAFGLPATIAPVTRDSEGLPIGVQILAPHGRDRTSIAVARLLEENGCGFVPPPSFQQALLV